MLQLLGTALEIAAVRRILTPLLLLCAAAAAEVEVIPLEDQPGYEAADRAVARELASPRNWSAEALFIAEIPVPPGGEVRPHHHVMEEVYHVAAGEGLMMVEDETRVVGPGDTIVIRPHEWHDIADRGEEELRLMVTRAPARAPECLLFKRDVMPGD